MAGSRLNRELGDAKLDLNEGVVRLREELLHDISDRKAYGQEDIEKEDRSSGARMFYTLLLTKLRLIYPQMLTKDGSPGSVALYRPKTDAEVTNDGLDLAVPGWYNYHKYFTGFPKDYIPEWGHYQNDTDGIAVREVRGWRSVLIAMVKQGLVTYDAVVAEFGSPENDQRSKYWFEQLKPYMHKETVDG